MLDKFAIVIIIVVPRLIKNCSFSSLAPSIFVGLPVVCFVLQSDGISGETQPLFCIKEVKFGK